MSSILKPGYVKWDGLKYIIDTDIIGPPGPPGKDGTSDLIYRPGGVTEGSVYAVWTDLMAKRATIPGFVNVIIDDSIVSPAIPDPGSWDMTDTRIIGINGPRKEFTGNPLTQLLLPDGVQLVNPLSFSYIDVTGVSASNPSIVISDGGFDAWDSLFHNDGVSAIPLIHTSGSVVINFYGSCHVVAANTSSFMIQGSDGYVVININDQSVVDGYSIQTSGPIQMTINTTGGGSLGQFQPGVSTSFTLVQQNPVQAVPRTQFVGFNPNLIVKRLEGYDPQVLASVNGATNLGTQFSGFGYNNSPTEEGVNADFAAVLSGENNNIVSLATHCIIVGGSGNNINSDGTPGNVPFAAFMGGGSDNVISGLGNWNCLVGGENNFIISCNTSSIVGGQNNQMNTVTGGFIAGLNNTVNNDWAASVGGNSNNSGGLASFVGGGLNNGANGDWSAVVGGDLCSAGAQGSIVLAGTSNIVNGNALDGVAMGNHASARLACQLAHGSGNQFGSFSNIGQFTRYMVTGVSTSATTISLHDEGNSGFLLENGKAYAVRATCIANRVGTAGRAMFIHTLLAHQNTTGGAFIDNDSTTLSVPNGQAWTIAFDINGGPGGSNSLRALFTGTNGHTVNVMVTYEWSEVGGGA